MDNNVVQKVQIEYKDFGHLMDKMVSDLQNILQKDARRYTAIHGLPRGGLSIAVHLSHFLELPLVLNVNQFGSEFPNGGKLLVVDDIIDSGRTFDRFLEIAKFKNIDFETAVLFYKPHSEYEPNYYVKETMDWIVFPWEPFEEIPNRELYEHLGGSIDSCDTIISENGTLCGDLAEDE